MKTVLFDLDGTLLPMDQDAFVAALVSDLAEELCRLGHPRELAERALAAAIPATLKNDGRATNREVFYHTLSGVLGSRPFAEEEPLRAYYTGRFSELVFPHRKSADVRRALDLVHECGGGAVLATSPFFPREAVGVRMAWAGLAPEDFIAVTSYERFSYCKPSLGYYRELLEMLSLRPEDCLMVGNDAREDMVAAELGMDVFLLTDCLINRRDIPIDGYPHGSFAELFPVLRSFCEG